MRKRNALAEWSRARGPEQELGRARIVLLTQAKAATGLFCCGFVAMITSARTQVLHLKALRAIAVRRAGNPLESTLVALLRYIT